MAEPEKKRNILLYLTAEGVVPVIGGCAGALAAGPVAGVAGVAVGLAVEKAINLFGRGIVDRWQGWFARHPAEAQAAVADLAKLPPAEIRAEAKSILLDLAPDTAAADLDLALDFISAIPRAVDRALLPGPAGVGRSLPPSVSFDDARSLLQLLPEDIPPYPSSADLPNTPYRLVELLGSGGFGTVYRAISPTLQHLPLAIKFCLDRSLLPALNQERSNLERLMRAGGRGSTHVVRLYGYDLDHPTPYLVYEFVDGGDLTRLAASRRAAGTGPPSPAEVLGWVIQIADGLAFAHRAGLVHRDLKPANVLIEAEGEEAQTSGLNPFGPMDTPLVPLSPPIRLKLADFGLGGVAAARAVARSRIGTSTVDYLSLADQASLFRGAGTPLYMSPEQRRGASPDPKHDLYALGVMWFQLLIGDVSRELHHGWAKELTLRFRVPADHIALIERCVGWYDERPKDAGELLPLLQEAAKRPPTTATTLGTPSIPPAEVAASTTLADTRLNATQATVIPQSAPGMSDGRRRGLIASLSRLNAAYAELDDMKHWRFEITLGYGFILGMIVGWLVGEFAYAARNDGVFWGPFDAIAVTLGLVAGLPVWGAYVWVIRSGVWEVALDLRKKIEGIVGEITSEFPDEVATWGGRGTLLHPATVRQLRQELAPLAAPSTTSTFTTDDIVTDPTRKAVLVARLRDMDKAVDGVEDAVMGSWFGLFALWVFAAPIVGMCGYALTHIALEQSQGLGGVVGVVVGLIVAGLSWWGMRAIPPHYRRKEEQAAERFLADYPQLVQQWGGREVLKSRETLAALIKTYTPESESWKPGWLRRFFGG